MCRILIMTGLNPKNKDLNWRFVEEMGGLMSKGNSDGLGYTAVTEDGSMFGERWLNNYDAFDYRPIAKETSYIKKFADFIEGSVKENVYNSFGNLTPDMKAITLHTRYATSPKGMNNVHPFVDMEHETSVIHNGSIRNMTTEDNIRSTCDSERILNMYLKHGINKDPAKFQSFVDELEGNFACGVFSRDGDGKRILDVFKSRAELSAIHIRHLGLVFATHAGDVHDACKELGLTITHQSKIKEDRHIRMDPILGTPIFTNPYRDTANVVRQYNTYTPSENFHSRRSAQTNSQTEKEIEEARTIISKKDTLNEDVAKLDGWVYDKTNTVWLRSNKKQG